MTTHDLNDGLFVDPIMTDPVIEGGGNIHCTAAARLPACAIEDTGSRPRRLQLQQALALPHPQPETNRRTDWMHARAALLAPDHCGRPGAAMQAGQDCAARPHRMH